MPRNCVNNPENFCCICGEVTFFNTKTPINSDGEKKLMDAISVAKSETKTKNGLLMYVVSLVLQFCVNGLITKGVQCLLPLP